MIDDLEANLSPFFCDHFVMFYPIFFHSQITLAYLPHLWCQIHIGVAKSHLTVIKKKKEFTVR